MNDRLIASVITSNVHAINAELKRLMSYMPEGSLYDNIRTGETNSTEFTGIVHALCNLIDLSKALKFGDDVDDRYEVQSQNVMLGTPVGECRR